MDRDFEHALKFLLKELATPGKVAGDRIILGAKIAASQINKKIRKYAGDYVLCSACGKPDTTIIKKEATSAVRCNACGSEHPVKSI